MSAGDFLFISGATGTHAGAINGGYDRTGEMCDGYALYRKRCDPGVIMEHREGNWEVKAVSSKGTTSCYAYVKGGCALAACTSRQWKVGDGKTWSDAPGVKMVTEAEVSCSRTRVFEFLLRSRPHCFPPHRLLTSSSPAQHASALPASTALITARVKPATAIRFLSSAAMPAC